LDRLRIKVDKMMRSHRKLADAFCEDSPGEWMTGKFAAAFVPTLLFFTVLLGAHAFAQTTPDQPPATTPAPTAQQPAVQPPAAQQPDTSQEPADEDSMRKKVKARDYKPWVFNVGAGANVDSGTTKTWVRGGGVVGAVGVAHNANKYLGLRADFFYANLPLRDSTLQLAQATGATSYALDLTLDPIINIPVTKEWGGYVLFGPGYFHRGGSLSGTSAVPGSGCNSFWTWWGACSSPSIPLNGSFASSSQNAFGYNFGGGVTRKVPSGVEIYLEYRFTHGAHNGITTDVRPITLGLRW
jgi:opacity protein-like surface antigen